MARKAKPPPSTLVFSAAEWVPLTEAFARAEGALGSSYLAEGNLVEHFRSGRLPTARYRGRAFVCVEPTFWKSLRAEEMTARLATRRFWCRVSPTSLLPPRASSWRARRSANSIRPILRLPARCRRLPTRSGAAAGLSSMIGIRSAARSHADASTRLVASRSPKMKASSLTTCLYGAKSNSAASPPPAQCVRSSERCVRRSARGRRRQRSGRGNFWHLLAFAG